MPTRDLTGRIVENLFLLQQVGNSLTQATRPLWEELFEQIIADLLEIDPTAPSAQRWRMYRTERFIELIEKRLRKAVPEWERTVRDHLAVFGRAQGKFAEYLMVFTLGTEDRVRPTPITQARVRAILNNDPFEGAVLKEWAAGLETTTRTRLARTIRIGMINEEPILSKTGPNLVERIRRVSGQTEREAEAIARTAVNFVSNRAQLETFRENGAILKGVEFSATLDDRTTLECASLDGQFWPLDATDMRVPPLHFNCRSVLVPVTDWEKVGLPPPEEGERAARDLSEVSEEMLYRPVSRRRGARGFGKYTTVPSSVRYEQWLRDQPKRVQDKVLGRTRAELFRARRITLRELVRTDGRVIPLTELRI